MLRSYLKTVTPSASSGQALSEAKGLVAPRKIFFAALRMTNCFFEIVSLPDSVLKV